ncbi:hypothetical protein FHS61_000013 [Altererythrobacter atlanticus]|uniref:Nickel uptake substrate-specific transmembrane region n=1 Tax=Croceibacterium atlanticum TaxID=1267766 RepID=A0A0F7KRL1_9SPHN|nr:DUF4198 domain-containing protein [Croceibacterium atlanticum]AKH42244.1 Nickel uptake substrate-specific transmembrane region [Croceibacterium atlanticum]MBB5731020.1 hypothetical protein [Croceibacterium atlanticum]
MFAKPSLIAAGLAVGLATLVPGKAEAHRRWLLPTMTTYSGESATVSVDAAASNELFLFEHRPLGLEELVITGPDGQPVDAKVLGTGDLRSAFDVPMMQQGTYRIAIASNGIGGMYELDGKRFRIRGGADEVPEGATNVRLSENAQRVETFVTLGAPTDTALQPTNNGLEMVPVTHPNDLVTSEAAQMRFLMDGQPAANMELEFVKGDTRWRDDAGIQMLTTDADGMVTLSVDEPGMYYIEAAQAGGKNADGIDRRASYTAVLEFMPL